jgi:hypothetical protein
LSVFLCLDFFGLAKACGHGRSLPARRNITVLCGKASSLDCRYEISRENLAVDQQLSLLSLAISEGEKRFFITLSPFANVV